MNLLDGFLGQAFSGGIRQVGQLSRRIDNVELLTTPISGTEAVIIPRANRLYTCGTLHSLQIEEPKGNDCFTVVFDSGETATQTLLPASIKGFKNFAAEPNTHYEISVMDGYAVIGAWEVSA